MKENAFIKQLLSHVSVRDFTDEPVSSEQREAILSAAFAASSSCFLQLVTVIRVTDSELRHKMYEASGRQQHVLKAPEFWVFCADFHRCAGLVDSPDLGWTEQFLTGTQDTGICAQNAMAALESLGLGGCFIGGLRNGIAEADRALGLPENVYPVLGLAFGHPLRRNELKPRLPLSVTVHENRYTEPSPEAIELYDEQMRSYYASRKHNPCERSWRADISSVLKRERRPFVLEHLQSKGFAKK